MNRNEIEQLEALLTAKDAHFEIAKETLLQIVACSDLPEDAVIARMAARPSGTQGGWQRCEDIAPVACAQRNGFKHYLFEC